MLTVPGHLMFFLAQVPEPRRHTESVQLCFDQPFTAPTVLQTCDAEGGKVVTRSYEFIALGKRKLPFSEDWQDLRGVGKATTHSCTRKTERRRRRRAISSPR